MYCHELECIVTNSTMHGKTLRRMRARCETREGAVTGMCRLSVFIRAGGGFIVATFTMSPPDLFCTPPAPPPAPPPSPPPPPPPPPAPNLHASASSSSFSSSSSSPSPSPSSMIFAQARCWRRFLRLRVSCQKLKSPGIPFFLCFTPVSVLVFLFLFYVSLLRA